MEINDLPTLFQIATAQENNAQHLEVIDHIVEVQQTEIEKIKKLVMAQQDLLDDIVHNLKALIK